MFLEKSRIISVLEDIFYETQISYKIKLTLITLEHSKFVKLLKWVEVVKFPKHLSTAFSGFRNVQNALNIR